MDDTSKIDRSKLKYRKSTCAVIVGNDNKVLIIQKRSYNDDEWDFPGGGVEDNETEEMAVLRELSEELGTNKFELVRMSEMVDQYDWPEALIEKKLKEKGTTWRGQQRYQFLVRFLGDLQDISIQEEELKKYRWVEVADLPELFIFPNQYSKTVLLLKELGLVKNIL